MNVRIEPRSPRLAAVLALWLGAALLFTLVVAPAAFAVLPSRALAGLVVGRVLPVLFWSGASVGVLALAVLRAGGSLRSLVGAMAALLVLSSLGAQLGVAPRIERARASLGVSLEAVDPSDPRRQEFGRLHGISVLMLGVGMVASAALVWSGLASRTGARPQLADVPSTSSGDRRGDDTPGVFREDARPAPGPRFRESRTAGAVPGERAVER